MRKTQMVLTVDFSFENEGTFDLGEIFDINVIDDYMVHIDTAFDGSSPTIRIHTDENPQTEIAGTGETDLTTVGGAKTGIFFNITSDVIAQATLDTGGSTQGSGTIYLYYV